MNNYLILGRLDHNNYGDILMAIIVASHIDSAGGKALLLNADEFVVRQIREYGYEVESIGKGDIESGLSISAAIFTGGGYFAHNLVNGISWCKSWLEHRYFSDSVDLFTKYRIPYYFLSVEVGPISSREMRQEVKRIFQSCEAVYSRNIESSKYAKKKLFCSKVFVSPDMVCSELAGIVKKHHSEYQKEKIGKIIGVHVTDKYNNSNILKRQFVRDLVASIKRNSNGISKIVLFSDNEETVVLDNAFTGLIKKIGNDTAIEVHRYSSVKMLVDVLLNVDVVVTTKLHVGVSVLAMGKAVLCCADSPKSKRFYKGVASNMFHIGFYISPPIIRQIHIGKLLNRGAVKSALLGLNLEFGYYKNVVKGIVNNET